MRLAYRTLQDYLWKHKDFNKISDLFKHLNSIDPHLFSYYFYIVSEKKSEAEVIRAAISFTKYSMMSSIVKESWVYSSIFPFNWYYFAFSMR